MKEMLEKIRIALVDNGFDCDVHTGKRNVLDIVWSCDDDDCAIDIILCLIRDVCRDINISYVGGGVCHAKLAVDICHASGV